MLPRTINKMLTIGLSLLGILSIALKVSSTLSDRECVSLLSETGSPISVYKYPNSPTFVFYQLPPSPSFFWVSKKTADNTWVQLYQAVTQYGNLSESDKVGWIKAEHIKQQDLLLCFPKRKP